MRTSNRRFLTTTAAIALAAGLVSATPSNAAPARVAAQGPAIDYVAMGDSFVAGPGISPQRPGTCGRSEKNFPSIVAAELGVASFTDASCGAATTQHYWAPQGENPPQLDALEPDTTLVTLGTMGGNDAGLVALAANCVVVGNCSDTPPDAYHEKIDALAPVYRRLVDDVRTRSPRATVVAVGYGTYVPVETCAALGAATEADLVYLQAIIDRLSDTMKAVAAEKRIAFVDMRTIQGWQQHSACAAPEDQWIRAFETYGDGAPLHPSTAGMAQMATKALETIEPLVTKPQGAKPTSAQRVAAAASTVRVRAVCAGPRPRKRVKIRTTGGKGLITFASFRVGRTWVGSDRRAPFKVITQAGRLRTKKARGPVRARVVLRHGDAVRVTTVTTKRPRCLR